MKNNQFKKPGCSKCCMIESCLSGKFEEMEDPCLIIKSLSQTDLPFKDRMYMFAIEASMECGWDGKTFPLEKDLFDSWFDTLIEKLKKATGFV